MAKRKLLWLFAAGALLLICAPLSASSISIEGAPADSGFDVGSVATIHAKVSGITGEASRYAVFAEIQYFGTTSTTSVQMDQVAGGKPGEAEYEVGWPIPAEAPTGLYTVTVRVEDRSAHRTVAMKKLRSFAAFRKLVRISHLAIDKTLYNAGDSIACEVALENLSDQELKDLRVEFSNANYPWISLYSAKESGRDCVRVFIQPSNDLRSTLSTN